MTPVGDRGLAEVLTSPNKSKSCSNQSSMDTPLNAVEIESRQEVRRSAVETESQQEMGRSEGERAADEALEAAGIDRLNTTPEGINRLLEIIGEKRGHEEEETSPMKRKMACDDCGVIGRFWFMTFLQIGALAWVGFEWFEIVGKKGDDTTVLEVAITLILLVLFTSIALTGWQLVAAANTDSVSGMVAQRYNKYGYLTILCCVATASFSRHGTMVHTSCHGWL